MAQGTVRAFVLLSVAALTAGCAKNDLVDVAENPPEAPAPEPPVPPPSPPPTPPPSPAPPSSGLDARPSNTSCLAPSRTTNPFTLGTERVFPNLREFDNPLAMLQAPNDSSRWFVIEKVGLVRTFANDPGVSTRQMFLNIGGPVYSSCDDCGLLGMAFHPDFPATPRVYLSFTSNAGFTTRISEFRTPDGGLSLDPNSERQIITVDQTQLGHYGGHIAFGPDGFLYIGIGDGGGINDVHGVTGNGQNLTTLLGKVLRIDIDRGGGGDGDYEIPDGNPFKGGNRRCGEGGTNGEGENCPEIYAWGFRHPSRWSFDRQTGDLWVGDQGQSTFEEVDRVALGGNYGWRCFEGTLSTALACGNQTTLRPPIAQYGRGDGDSITGGYVYRGAAISALAGRYVFGDFGSGRVWHIANDTAPTLNVSAAASLNTPFNISAFGQGNDGELYIVSYGDGQLHRITGSTVGGSPVATELSATGCVGADASQPSSGLIPYQPSAPFWADGAAGQQWIGLPNGQNISVNANDDWSFPNGTVLRKDFRLGSRLVETQLLMRHPDGVWAGYSYEWNAAQTDATLVVGGKQVTVAGQPWIFPSQGQCLACHTPVAGDSLGLETKQLAFNITYPQTGRNAHQLVTLNAINTLSPPIANPTEVVPYPNPYGRLGTLAERARAYLHTNCSQCHRPGVLTSSNMDLRYSTALAQTNACDVGPTSGDLGINDARIIAVGSASRSVLLARMNRRDVDQMPPAGLSARVDQNGVELVRDWINSLSSCN
jgi:uncharacterized repeat protein (TIGR03806 family)